MSNVNLLADELFIDAVAEILNIGMGTAAASLSEMINKEVLLSIPRVEFVPRETAYQVITGDRSLALSGVSERFEGAFKGQAILLFPERQSLELVRALLRQSEGFLDNLSEMEQEAITEIGNVILNACLSSIANLLDKNIESSVPEFINGSIEKILSSGRADDSVENIVLLLNMDFSIEQMAIQGYVTFLLDADFIDDLKAGIDGFLAA